MPGKTAAPTPWPLPLRFRANEAATCLGSPCGQPIENGIRARWIELCDDSATWPCDLSGARYALFQVPISQEIHDAAGKLNTPKPRGLLTAEAVLEANGIQDLADQIPDIAEAAVGNDLKFNVRVEFGGETTPHPETVEKINTFLSEVSNELKLRSKP